MSDILE